MRSLLWLFALCSFSSAANACAVPLYRFAFEQWSPDGYLVQVLHRGELSAEHKALIQEFQKKSYDFQEPVNIGIQEIDLNAENLDPALVKAGEGVGDQPQMIVSFPGRQQVDQAAWKGELTTKNIDAMIDSPARRELSKRLLAGDSAVWLLLIGDDQAQVDQVAKRIEDECAKTAESMNDPNLPADQKPQIATRFSLLRVRQDDPAESFLVTVLKNRFAKDPASKESLAGPVFGQGRALCAEPLSKWSEDEIMQANGFLCSPCSCIVQDMKPGVELPVKANWHITGPKMTEDKTVPPLSGFTPPAVDPPKAEEQPQATPPPAAAAEPVAPAPSPKPTTAAESPDLSAFSITGSFWMIIGGAVAVIIVVSLLIMTKRE